jgi:hypothetical protein
MKIMNLLNRKRTVAEWLAAIALLVAIMIPNGVPAFATIPLILDHTIQLPPGGGWDLQHIVDDTSFGWARLIADSLMFKRQESDTVTRIAVPHCDPDPAYSNVQNLRVRLLKTHLNEGHLFAVIYSRTVYRNNVEGESTHNVLGLLDLETGECVDTVIFSGGYSSDNGSSVHTWLNSTINQIHIWPPLPRVSTHLFYTVHTTIEQDVPTEGTYSGVSATAAVVELNAAGTVMPLGPFREMQLFYRSAAPMFVANGSDSYTHNPDYLISSHCWIGTYNTPNGITTDSTLGCHSVAAQQDADGTLRMIYCGAALNPSNRTVLWTNPDMLSGNLYSARFYDSPDERIVVSTGQTIAVYDASDGASLDRSTVYSGILQTVLKSENRPSEFLTFDSNLSIVRIYTAAPPAARGVTIAYSPERRVIRLNWNAAPEATGHRVYAMDRPSGGNLQLLAVLPAGTLSYDVLPDANVKFFYVTDDYEAR